MNNPRSRPVATDRSARADDQIGNQSKAAFETGLASNPCIASGFSFVLRLT